MDDVKPQEPWHYGQTGTTGAELDKMDRGFKTTSIEKMFPLDSMGNRLSLGNTVAHVFEEMEVGTITTRRFRNDPPQVLKK